jgi:hypothetical protein
MQALITKVKVWKSIIFLAGTATGVLLAFFLGLPYKTPLIVELDLSKIITNFSVVMAKEHKPDHKAQQEFKEKFQQALQLIPKHAIIVGKNQVLSKHLVVDHTRKFLAHMGVKHLETEKSK